MKLFINKDGLNIDGLVVSMADFAKLEPNIVPLPDGYKARAYKVAGADKTHFMFTESDAQVAGPMPYADGDLILSKKDTYAAALGNTSLQQPPNNPADALDKAFQSNPAFRAIISLLADMRNVTTDQVLAKLKTYL